MSQNVGRSFRASVPSEKRVFFVILVCLNIFSCLIVGQEVGDEGSSAILNGSIASLPKNEPTFNITYANINICADGDKLSLVYCNCTEQVASCDFTKYPGALENRTELGVFVDDMKYRVKRLCICGGPKHVRLNVTRKLKSTMNNKLGSLHRVDIYNISGPLLITEAFQAPFAGDFYMMNVKELYSLRTEEFNRGSDMKIEDVQDLDCCSEIKVSQLHSKPTFYMDSVRIERIYTRSISSYHVWRTIILKHSTVKRLYQRGIALESTTEHVNVSITHCKFENVSNQGIVLEDFHNAFISKNYFGPFTNSAAIEATSKIENSSLIVLDNWFNNELVLNMSAHRVLNWFNLYNFWDYWTFAFYPDQSFSDAIYSIEYNTVQHFMMNESDPLSSLNSSMLSHDKVIFHENVLGSCNCSLVHGTFLPERISTHTSRCDSLPFTETPVEPNPSENCLVDFKSVMTTCTEQSKELNPAQLCKSHGIKKPSFSLNTMKKLAFQATGFKIISPFISEMLKELKFRFFIHKVFHHSEEDEEKQYSQYSEDDDASDGNKEDVSASHAGLVIFFILLSITILVGGLFVLVKQRKLRRIITRDSRCESYDVLTTST